VCANGERGEEKTERRVIETEARRIKQMNEQENGSLSLSLFARSIRFTLTHFNTPNTNTDFVHFGTDYVCTVYTIYIRGTMG